VSGSSRPQFLAVSACYQVFTLSDGALRMLVLLHLHEQGRTALALALVLLPYEVAGVFANLLGGVLSSRFGQRLVLVTGLALQGLSCAMLAVEAALLSVPLVMATQVMSGVAKDLAKTAAKSYTRALAVDDGSSLFLLVAFMTGSKNAVKGLGFFVGGALLSTLGFRHTNTALAVLLVVAAILAARLLPEKGANRRAHGASILRQERSVQWLALARLFLFGSRDVWFAVALPLFLASVHSWSSAAIGAFLSAWVIGYGAVQAAAPRWLRTKVVAVGARQAVAWTALLLVPLGATAWLLAMATSSVAVVAVGVCAYGVVFAVCSSLHSWLVVALANRDDVAERVGFYYAANSVGRVVGTLASGWLFDLADGGTSGLGLCMSASAVMVLLAASASLPMAARARALSS
jgi:predicted MFS family arabinose efflux permease